MSAPVCPHCGSADCVRRGGEVCWHTRKRRDSGTDALRPLVYDKEMKGPPADKMLRPTRTVHKARQQG